MHIFSGTHRRHIFRAHLTGTSSGAHLEARQERGSAAAAAAWLVGADGVTSGAVAHPEGAGSVAPGGAAAGVAAVTGPPPGPRRANPARAPYSSGSTQHHSAGGAPSRAGAPVAAVPQPARALATFFPSGEHVGPNRQQAEEGNFIHSWVWLFSILSKGIQ